MRDVLNRAQGLSTVELETMRSVEDDFWWYRALRNHVLDSIPVPRPEFKLLDAGCGSGGMLARVRERFPQTSLTGVDVSQHALELTGARHTNAQLMQGSVNQLPLDDAAFDTVLSIDVLYHRDVDDRAALREMRRVLRDDGTLIVNVPAFDFLRGSHDVAVATARRYTRKQLKILLREAGFTIRALTYWNMTLFPAVAAVRWASRGKAQGSNVRSDLTPYPNWLNATLLALTQFEFALSRRIPLPFGTSLFAVARK